MKLKDLKIVDKDGYTGRLDAANLSGVVVEHLDTYRKAGEGVIFFDSLLPDIFRDKATGEDVEVTVGDALDMIAGR